MISKARREMIRRWAQRGYDIDTTARLMSLSREEVLAVLTHPEPAEPPSRQYGPEFIEPPSFDGLD
ncbi:hypothetical protein JS533_001610 [Bifidobacterium amazonense]|uniref:Uncharacterized protein n=1 Tax=Bifidobacterium amazonense TaxID=2809027 RepID=A0ABS9VSQ1_9BIFI|nr:hypothetical protein [Bifidobacterium amazonense]MCH9274986.1 hypothetical protein [Bifidobacterium amazonense]